MHLFTFMNNVFAFGIHLMKPMVKQNSYEELPLPGIISVKLTIKV